MPLRQLPLEVIYNQARRLLRLPHINEVGAPNLVNPTPQPKPCNYGRFVDAFPESNPAADTLASRLSLVSCSTISTSPDIRDRNLLLPLFSSFLLEIPNPPTCSACTKAIATSFKAQEPVDVSPEDESEASYRQLADEALLRHDEKGFTLYFDHNFRTLEGTIPLTIFNKAWKDPAIITKRTNAPSQMIPLNRSRYTGFPYPSEWAQTFSEWTQNLQGFYSTLMKGDHKSTSFCSMALDPH
ncbi:hypothetical protein MJO28_016586 [Puccinia striiformis f. sp. tritici]|uniref:Uncharacterized protein n=3 Tax=Puccinia striiformis TaxID=27350 RepID=A0A2S4UAS0_9BASI|nr:hypothetical protein MJO28_016586 [Puccinia striiformis f. sp. tritici]POV94383.1 hypothetical protein PSHT_16244 [Puccinia striiformis]POW16047.1 hypothetical protein PSTT_01574 [Puccinia striiformis]